MVRRAEGVAEEGRGASALRGSPPVAQHKRALGGEGGDGVCEGDGTRVPRTGRGEGWAVEVKRTVSRRE